MVLCPAPVFRIFSPFTNCSFLVISKDLCCGDHLAAIKQNEEGHTHPYCQGIKQLAALGWTVSEYLVLSPSLRTVLDPKSPRNLKGIQSHRLLVTFSHLLKMCRVI